MGGRGLVAVDAGEDEFGGFAAEGGDVLAQHGDGGFEHVGEGEVVEADECDPVVQVAGPEGAHRADGDEVLRGEQRGRWFGQVEQGRGGGLGGVGAVQVGADEFFVQGEAGVGESFQVTGVALLAGPERLAVTEEGDAPMAAPGQVEVAPRALQAPELVDNEYQALLADPPPP